MRRLSVTYNQKPKPGSNPKSQRMPSRASSVKSRNQHHDDYSFRKSLKPNNIEQYIRPSSVKHAAAPKPKPSKLPMSRNVQKKEKKEAYKEKFMEVVEKVFKRVDLLNEKYIDSFSIGKCVNQKILYFFGSIFHRIKTKNLRMGKYQFMVHAEKVFQKSSLLDIKDLVRYMTDMMYIDEVHKEPAMKKSSDLAVKHKQVKQQETSQIVMRGEAAINQAMAHRKKFPLNQIQKQFDFSKIDLEFHSKQKATPLFQGNSNIGLMELDLNRPVPYRTSLPESNKSFQGRIVKQPQTDYDMKPSYENETRTAEEDSHGPSKIPNFKKQNRKIISESRKRIEQSKLLKLQDRIDYFIQKNSEHLHVSQCIRLQNGF